MATQQQVNLMVALRIRPLAQEEKAKGATQAAYRIDEKMVVLLDPGDHLDDVLRQKRSREKRFIFDVALGPESTQEETYAKTTKPLIDNVVNGYNATVFAYGATGAGKTFTMLGTEMNHGIMTRALDDLFAKIEQNKDVAIYDVKMSYLEIYNEMIRDLLQPPAGYLDVREDSKGGIQVVGLSETSTTSSDEILSLLMEGNKRRTQEPTVANKTSSRSHAILQVTVMRKNRVRGVKALHQIGKLFLIDLAGSERASNTQNTGQRLKEGAHINRSLLALGNVINTLVEKGARYVNYRDSKLTRLLKDSLSGNSRTVMIANISPASSQFEESRNTLIYADRAKNISTKISRNNQDVTFHVTQYQSIISELRKEISRLKTKIDEQNGLTVPSGLMRSESALSFPVRDKHSLNDSPNFKDRLPPIVSDNVRRYSNLTAQPQQHQRAVTLSADFYRVKDEMTETFRQQMALRQKLFSLNEEANDVMSIMSDQEKELNEMQETGQDTSASKIHKEMDTLQKRLKEIDKRRTELEMDMTERQKKLKHLEETLSQRVTANEEREMLNFCKRLHEAEIEKVALHSDAMLLQRRLKRQESSIRRLKDYSRVADEVISVQQNVIQGNRLEYPQNLQTVFHDYEKKKRGVNTIITNNTTGQRVLSQMDLDQQNAVRNGKILNKTLNATELQNLKRMHSMMEKERSDLAENKPLRRWGSAGSLAQLPIIESNDDAYARKGHKNNRRKNTQAPLSDIRNLSKDKRSAAAAAAVSWKSPVATPITYTDSNAESGPSTADSSFEMQYLNKFTAKSNSKRKPAGVIATNRKHTRVVPKRQAVSLKSKKKEAVDGANRRHFSDIASDTEEYTSTLSAAEKNRRNRRIRSPTQPRLPVIR